MNTRPYIDIENTTFFNLGFHQVVERLHLKSHETDRNSLWHDQIDKEWETFINRGLIINAQRFRGDIKVKNSLIEHNMVYIKEIFLEPVRITKTYYDVDDGDGLANFGAD